MSVCLFYMYMVSGKNKNKKIWYIHYMQKFEYNKIIDIKFSEHNTFLK